MPSGMTVEQGKEIAEAFIKSEATYRFDGYDLVYNGYDTMRCPDCIEYIFEFYSGHVGYGDRTGQVLAQFTKYHRMVVVVTKWAVTSAIMDDKWDMVAQKMLEAGGGPGVGLANPASVYCEEQYGEIVIRETPEGQAGYCSLPDRRVCEEWEFFRSNGTVCDEPE